MLREIILDTETTGLDANGGDRLVELGCIEIVNRTPSGREFHRFINPVRKTFTSRLPHSAVAVIAWPLSVLLQALVKGVYRPLRTTSIFRALPSHDYLYSLSAFGFRQNYSIVFDHLVAPVAFYLKREEFQEWFRAAALDEIQISWRNQNSWRGFGRRARPEPSSG